MPEVERLTRLEPLPAPCTHGEPRGNGGRELRPERPVRAPIATPSRRASSAARRRLIDTPSLGSIRRIPDESGPSAEIFHGRGRPVKNGA